LHVGIKPIMAESGETWVRRHIRGQPFLTGPDTGLPMPQATEEANGALQQAPEIAIKEVGSHRRARWQVICKYFGGGFGGDR
jgi:hypothetical protein